VALPISPAPLAAWRAGRAHTPNVLLIERAPQGTTWIGPPAVERCLDCGPGA
jgi:hypothetical protein